MENLSEMYASFIEPVTKERAWKAMETLRHNAGVMAGLGSGLAEVELKGYAIVERYIKQLEANQK